MPLGCFWVSFLPSENAVLPLNGGGKRLNKAIWR